MARFKVGDRVIYHGELVETVALAEPDAMGDIITVDTTGGYMFRCESECELAPPPDPCDAVVEAAVAQFDRAPWVLPHAIREAVEAYKAAQT